MKKKMLCFMFIFIVIAYSQTASNTGINTSLFTSSISQNNISTGQRNFSGNYFPINPQEYIVDSGDEFFIKIDIPGPEVKTYNIKVSSDGYLFIPDAPGIFVRGEVLISAKEMIVNHLIKYFNNAEIEVFLDKTHTIHVYLSGALNQYKTIELNSGNRIYDLLELVINDYQSDTTLNNYLKVASLRNVTINRNNQYNLYDILAFRITGRGENPYLMNDDVIHIPYRDTTAGDITVDGMVGLPNIFEYKLEDKLSDAIELAGGMLSSADSNNIMLYRYIDTKDTFQSFSIDYNKDSCYSLYPDDRIYIRRKTQYRNKTSVTVNGYIKYPGEYPIIPNKTTLLEIIRQAGGVTDYADLKNSRLLRIIELPGSNELERINQSLMTSMTRLERDYWSSSTNENLSIIDCDFSSILNDNDRNNDVILNNGDIIEIMGKIDYVYVSGAVVNPGMIRYNNDWDYKKYIAAAGGYKERAKKNSVKIIKNKDENWLDARRDYPIEDGDRLFVPQRAERDFLSYSLQALSILSQVATIVLVITSY